MPRATRTLADMPELLRSFDPERNGEINPRLIALGSDKKLWWRCPEGPDHVWEARVDSRSRGKGCPFCAGKRISVTNRLSTVAPGLAMDWHPTKNGKRTPDDVTRGYDGYVWWQCTEGPDHEWRDRVDRRTRLDAGCPFCAGQRRSVTTRLSTVAPELAAEWHPTKNGTLTPDDVVAGSDRRVWWRCPKGSDHVWEAAVYTRRRHPGCPYCTNRRISVTNCLSALAPHVARQWHPTKNRSMTPDDVGAGSPQPAWWQCPEGPDHTWRAGIAQRVKLHTGCPFCAGNRASVTNSLATQRPDIASEWHPTKNGKLTPRDVTPGSARKVWWQCARNPRHEWQARIMGRRKHPHCPHCANRIIRPHRLLAAVNPARAAMWHPTKNGDLTPFDVTVHCPRRVFWKCQKGPDHEWECSVRVRNNSKNPCPFCFGRRVSVTNCLATLYPALALRWHPTRNGSLSPWEVHGRSDKQAWWRCPAGHVFRARVLQLSVEQMQCPGCRHRKPRQALTHERRRKVWLPGDWK